MLHTMARMGDVLAGFHAAWEFESDSVLIRFERGIRTPKLFQALGERRIPLEAIAAVTLTPGRRGTVVLRAEPRPGADPLMEAAAGQLKEACDPYRLVLPGDRETLAEYYADELRAQLVPDDAAVAERYLVNAPFGIVGGGALQLGACPRYRLERDDSTAISPLPEALCVLTLVRPDVEDAVHPVHVEERGQLDALQLVEDVPLVPHPFRTLVA